MSDNQDQDFDDQKATVLDDVQWTKQMVEDLAEENGVQISMFEPADVFCKGIVGYDMDSFALVYDYDKLAEALAEDYLEFNSKKNDDDEDKIRGYGFDEAYLDAVEWIDYNTLRTIPYMPGVKPIVINCGRHLQ